MTIKVENTCGDEETLEQRVARLEAEFVDVIKTINKITGAVMNGLEGHNNALQMLNKRLTTIEENIYERRS